MTQKIKGASLTLESIFKNYGSVAAAQDISIDVNPGEFISLLGPSGSGKTTTLNMIAGFEEPTAGTISIDGTDVTSIPIHKRNIGMVFQGYALFPHMSVEKNVEYPLKQHGFSRADRGAAVANALKKVSLEGFRERMPAQLSGGQRQRVALARAIAYDPPLLLMDEPLSALDRALRESLQGEIRRIHRELGTTVIYVTHDQDEALALSDRIVVFNEGRVQQIGTPSELYLNPANDFVSRFLGESIHVSGTVRSSAGGSIFDAGGTQWQIEQYAEGPAEAMIRPESVALSLTGSDAGAGPGVDAVVRDIVYMGHSVKYSVEFAGTGEQEGNGVVRMSSQIAPDVSVGDSVHLSWEAESAKILSPSSISSKDA
ncbi:ABC transporter ATP-binding protein [Brevibacterium sp. 91QC2O2]|uniref:ABC transporter ATP-binding protein n=1 Tax=Brevibacterium sp. 91QC2O2 TaxID=2968458 RepID=UPI00211C8BAE|nr:ABC transporter ATP-binding protein [Brevibacterium sp. 91QC2O2]MCQ9368831.1 ABC transporter ATP-binding protein [Brevibacterium sp. 91QC2O2]